MAEKTVKKFEDQLNCSICLDTYTNPRLLQCLHAHCQQCLVRLVVRDQQGQGRLILTCPICRQVTPVPANGVAGLQPAFQINHFLQIMDDHKKEAAAPSASTERESSITSCAKIKVCCPEHNGKEVELYCKTCEEPICYKCGLKGGKHYSHDYEELDKAFQQYKREITASLGPMEKQLTMIQKVLAQLDTRCEEISAQRVVVEADIHSTFNQIQEILDVRKTKLIGQLHQLTQGKLKGLAVQRDQMETTQAQLSSCLGFMKESLSDTGSQEEVLLMKTMVVKQVKELTTAFQPDWLKPNTETDVEFLASADINMACKNFGEVCTVPGLDPSKCHITSNSVAVVGQMSTAVIQAIDINDQPCKKPIRMSECELVSEINGTRRQCRMERRGQSQYEISYKPTIKGRHQLHIKVEGQHIRRSPFSVAVTSPVEKIGTPILTIQGVNQPWGVAINQGGEMVVTEKSRHCVSVFSPSGERLQSFGTHGSGQERFKGPLGVTVDGKGNILVADSANHRIQKFTAEKQFLMAVGSRGTGPLQFDTPKFIAFNASNNMIYVTDNNHRVQALNSDLTFSNIFGKYGSGKGHFKYPYGITCDSTGKVYVADAGNDRIQVFTATGKFLCMFGRHGAGRGELNYPIGVAIDAGNMVYVSEEGNDRVSVFTSDGAFRTSFGSRGQQPGQFHNPYGIAVADGVVYVCNCVNDCLQLF